MTDNEIIKALECCFFKCDCAECSCYIKDPNDKDCLVIVGKLAIDLVKRQQEEIERLKKLRELAAAEREANVKGFTEALNAIKQKTINEIMCKIKSNAQVRDVIEAGGTSHKREYLIAETALNSLVKARTEKET